MSVVSFNLVLVYSKAIEKLNLSEEVLLRLINEIYTISEFDIQKKNIDFSKIPLLDETKNLLKILGTRGEMNILKSLSQALRKSLVKAKNAISVEVRTFSKLVDADVSLIKGALKEKFHKSEVIIEEIIDKTLLGGFVIRFNSFQLDFSKRDKISKIKSCILKY
jgi:F-type H+-transporting ATPase subunit delta